MVDVEEIASVHAVVLALIAEVVNDVHATGLSVAVLLAVLVAQVHRHQASLPIVRDEDDFLAVGVAADVEDERSLHGGGGKQREAQQIVVVLAAVVAVVEAGTALDARVVDEDVVATLAITKVLVDVPILDQLILAGQSDPRLADVRESLVVLILRRDSHGAVAVPGELIRVGGCDQAQAARLRVGRHLGAHDDNRHVQVEGGVLRLAPLPDLVLGRHVCHLRERREARDVLQAHAAVLPPRAGPRRDDLVVLVGQHGGGLDVARLIQGQQGLRKVPLHGVLGLHLHGELTHLVPEDARAGHRPVQGAPLLDQTHARRRLPVLGNQLCARGHGGDAVPSRPHAHCGPLDGLYHAVAREGLPLHDGLVVAQNHAFKFDGLSHGQWERGGRPEREGRGIGGHRYRTGRRPLAQGLMPPDDVHGLPRLRLLALEQEDHWRTPRHHP
mmetsp:Transcript_62811/g.162312  ORF Transcript_62811/g.162312 Transcript_62811/m.162312 type:complete len:443 (-) Transcript_62811:39-1367(-)